MTSQRTSQSSRSSGSSHRLNMPSPLNAPSTYRPRALDARASYLLAGQRFPPEACLAVMMSFPASSSWVATPAAPPENTIYLESTSVWFEGYRPTTSRRACSLVPATGCPLLEHMHNP
ncbi:hypothetical protein BGW80DRAFT_255176 [Lactifluus volemus]|nr:hypothetical protein BGW80DRAFT_255176 [Lactifluus volemus]